MIYPETVVILRAELVTARGVESRDWSDPTETTVVGVQVQPSESIEPTEVGRGSVVTHMRLITPIGTDLDLLRTDRVRWAGVVWLVDGEVSRHMRPSNGEVHHVEATLMRVAG